MVFVGSSLIANAKARRWPATTGTVIESRVLMVDISPTKKGSQWVPQAEVKFRYEVDKKFYESMNLKYGMNQIGGTHRRYAPEVAARYPVGAPLPVSYDPANPADAVSDLSPGSYAWLRVIAGLLLLSGGVYYLSSHRRETGLSHPGPADALPKL